VKAELEKMKQSSKKKDEQIEKDLDTINGAQIEIEKLEQSNKDAESAFEGKMLEFNEIKQEKESDIADLKITIRDLRKEIENFEKNKPTAPLFGSLPPKEANEQKQQMFTQTSPNFNAPSRTSTTSNFFEFYGQRARIYRPDNIVLPSKSHLVGIFKTVVINKKEHNDPKRDVEAHTEVNTVLGHTLRHYVGLGVNCGRCGKEPGNFKGIHNPQTDPATNSMTTTLCPYADNGSSETCKHCNEFEMGIPSATKMPFNIHATERCPFSNPKRFMEYIYHHQKEVKMEKKETNVKLCDSVLDGLDFEF